MLDEMNHQSSNKVGNLIIHSTPSGQLQGGGILFENLAVGVYLLYFGRKYDFSFPPFYLTAVQDGAWAPAQMHAFFSGQLAKRVPILDQKV